MVCECCTFPHSLKFSCAISEEGLSRVSPISKTVTTPTNSEYFGEEITVSDIVAVSIIRAGDSMLETFMSIAPEAAVGMKISTHLY